MTTVKRSAMDEPDESNYAGYEPNGARGRFLRIEDKIDGIAHSLAKLEVLVENGTAREQDHERRIRILERWKYTIPASILMAIAAFLGARINP